MIAVFVFAAVPAYAQSLQEAGVDKAQSNLEYTLGTLQDSVARLNVENKALAAANDDLRIRLRPFADRLRQEQLKGVSLARQLQSVDARYQKKAAEISLVNSRLGAVAGRRDSLITEKLSLENEVKLQELKDSALTVQADSISREIRDIRSGFIPGEKTPQDLDPLRNEQARLQPQLDDSSAKLQQAMDEWKELTVAINAGPAQVDALAKDQAGLKADISRRRHEVEAAEKKLAMLSREVERTAKAYDPGNISELERGVNALAGEAASLEKENADLELKVRPNKISAGAHSRLKKDEARFKDLYQRNRDLTMELRNVQRNMVIMDKKKSDLEKEIDAGLR
jgi:chromosome segregation ATPase